MDLYELVVEDIDRTSAKALYTHADSAIEAGEKFHRHMVCQWVGLPWGDDAEVFLAVVFPKLEDGAFI